MASHIDGELYELFRKAAKRDAGYAIAFALMQLAEAQDLTAHELKYLGNGDASTPMGAIEAFGKHMGEAIEELGDKLAGAAEDAANTIADAIRPEAEDQGGA